MATVHHPKTTLLLSVSLFLSLFVSADVVAAPQALATSTVIVPEGFADILRGKIVPIINTVTRKETGSISNQKFFFKGLKDVAKKLAKEASTEVVENCSEMLYNNMKELNEINALLLENNVANKKEINTKLSAIETNEDTCLGGFATDTVKRKAREGYIRFYYIIIAPDAGKALALLNAPTGTGAAELSSALEARRPAGDWPDWLSDGDRRLLQASTVKADATVAQDGSGDYRTVGAAVRAAPEGSTRRYVIRIKAGEYKENVVIPLEKTNLTFVGDGPGTTIITGNRSVGDALGSTTFSSATVAVVGRGFLARDITFKNAAGRSKGRAVALRVNADRCAFYRCNILAFRNTLYVHSYRQFYTGCLVAGTKDFIFGNAAAVFQDCDIRARRPNPGQRNTVTFQGRSDPNADTGIVINRCRIGAATEGTFPTYLGRPWKRYSRTVVMHSIISDVIHPAGWLKRKDDFPPDDLFYAEYNNTGAGADTGGRVKWGGFRVLTSALEAQPFTTENFIGDGN